MQIADLNHLETVEANVTGGIQNRYVSEVLSFNEHVSIGKYISGKADVKGNVAFAQGDAVALGKNSLSNALSVTFTDGSSSASSATSASASDNGYGSYSHGYK